MKFGNACDPGWKFPIGGPGMYNVMGWLGLP